MNSSLSSFANFINNLLATIIVWSVTLGAVAGIVLVVLTGLIGVESITDGSDYFVPHAVQVDNRD